MKVCVLLPDYSTSNVDYQNYDPPRNLAPLLPKHQVTTVFLNKLTTYKQLKLLSKQNFDIYINLCEGYLEWDVPSIDVIYSLELLNLPFTGPTSVLYDPPKTLMKYVAYCENILTPKFVVINACTNIEKEISQLKFPLFVKPAKAGDSLGVDDFSLVKNKKQLSKKTNNILKEFDEVLIEEYISGREFTVLVIANKDGKTITALEPIEYIFPEGKHYKTYALKTAELHTDANVLVKDKSLSLKLKNAATKIFKGFNGKGYARLDFRMNSQHEIYFLEINFTSSEFYTNGYEGSADYILKLNGYGQQKFLQHIIKEGIERHAQQQKKYVVKSNATNGYGIYATKEIKKGTIIFKGEEANHRIVTKKFVDKNWSKKEKEVFKHYAYPINKEVYILWSLHPSEWAPQNHSCHANTAYNGLNVIATKNIKANEELTINYAHFLDETAQPFQCNCKSKNCMGLIKGKKGNGIGK